MKLKIGPMTYQFERTKNPQILKNLEEHGGALGLAHHIEQKIIIVGGLSPELEKLIFMHEILHCIATVYGVSQLDDDEDAIQSLSVGLVAFFKDNPAIAKKILEEK